MIVHHVTPILNVSNLAESFGWFEKLGWSKRWEWGDPPDFGSVGSGRVEIFLCVDGQGCRGGPLPRHTTGDDAGGTWMTWWLGSPDQVDTVHALAKSLGVLVSQPPADMPWNVRECHLRHPDGHTFRVTASTGEGENENPPEKPRR